MQPSSSPSLATRNRQNHPVATVDLSNHAFDAPLGVLLVPSGAPNTSCVTLVAGWEHNNTSLGPIQRSGQVRLGDRLVCINDTCVTHMTFRQIMDLLKTMKPYNRLRSIGFAAPNTTQQQDPPTSSSTAASVVPAAESFSFFSRTTNSGTLQRNHTITSEPLTNNNDKSLYEFRSYIRRARTRTRTMTRVLEHAESSPDADGTTSSLSSEGGGSRFYSSKESKEKTHEDVCIEYEIECYLKTRYQHRGTFRAGGEADERTWTVWKRYSEFKELDQKLRISHGWQIDALNNGQGIVFPSSRLLWSLVGGTFDADFVRQRRDDLDAYWQSIQQVDGILDFRNPGSQQYSRDLALFLFVDDQQGYYSIQTNRTNRALESFPTSTASISQRNSMPSSSRPWRMDHTNVSLGVPPQSNVAFSFEHPLSVSGDCSAGASLSDVFGNESVASMDGNSHHDTASRTKARRRKKRIPKGTKTAFQRHLLSHIPPPNEEESSENA